jgi:hypothetical protein
MKFKLREKHGLPEIYKFYRLKFTKRERECSEFVDYKTFAGIIKDFNKELIRIIIEEGSEFKLPVRMGYFRIQKFRKKIRFKPDGTIDKSSLRVDWNATKKLWAKEYPGKTMEDLKKIEKKPLVYFLNEHTDGYLYKFFWNKKGSNARNRGIFTARFADDNHRYLAKVLKDENRKTEYYG